MCDPCNKRGSFGKYALGPSINGLVTDGNTKLCCRVFILALFQSRPTSANKIDSGHTRAYKKLFPVRIVEILHIKVKNILKFCHLYRLISDGFRLKVQKIAKKCTLVSC